ncbi:MAG TPA: AAA family ATPase, partial [Rhodobacteraceae bacterium]|nr:AAA family ATPase [Paracoccaceae bacterium]
MVDLFDTGAAREPQKGLRPLADRLRPQSLAEVIGQKQVLGEGAPLEVMLSSGSLSSIVFWGPPGVGKTTIARLLAHETELHFVQISAIFTGMPDLRKVFEGAKIRRQNGQGTLLFVDEIHRFNKAQ